METAKIYVDIESLLDLRQAALYKLVEDKEKLATYLNTDDYNCRVYDRFSIVDQKKYDHVYSILKKEDLQYSTVTYILFHLRNKINHLENRNKYYGETKKPELVVNTFPIIMSPEEANYIRNLIFVKLKTDAIISMVYIPTRDLSPYYLKTNGVVSCFMYNISKWMNLHMDALSTQKLPDTILYFPAIGHEEIDSKEEERVRKMGFSDHFSYLEFFMANVVPINFLPVPFYSNLITASVYTEKYGDQMKKHPLDNEEKKHGDSSSEIQVPR